MFEKHKFGYKKQYILDGLQFIIAKINNYGTIKSNMEVFYVTNRRLEDTNEDLDLLKMVEEYERDEAASQQADFELNKDNDINEATDVEEDSVFVKRPIDERTRVMSDEDLAMQDKTLTILPTNKKQSYQSEEEEVVLKSVKPKNSGKPPKKDDNDKQNKIITGVIIAVVTILLIVGVVFAMNFFGGSDDGSNDDDITDVNEQKNDKDKDKDKDKNNQKEENTDKNDGDRDCTAENNKLDQYIKEEEAKIAAAQKEKEKLNYQLGSLTTQLDTAKTVWTNAQGAVAAKEAEKNGLDPEKDAEAIKKIEEDLVGLKSAETQAKADFDNTQQLFDKCSADIQAKENAIAEAQRKINEYESQKNTCI